MDPMMALWCPSSVSSATWVICSSLLPKNCSHAARSISSFWPWILTWKRMMSNHGLEWKKMIFGGNEIEVDDELARQETEKRKWTVAPFPLVFPWQSEFRCVPRFLITAGEVFFLRGVLGARYDHTRSDPFKNWGNGGKRVNKGEIKIVSWVFDLIAVTFSFSDFLNLLF